MMLNSRLDLGRSSNFYEMNDVKTFAQNIEMQVASMEQGGWFPKENRMRGWIVELRRGCLEREMRPSRFQR